MKTDNLTGQKEYPDYLTAKMEGKEVSFRMIPKDAYLRKCMVKTVTYRFNSEEQAEEYFNHVCSFLK